MTVSTRPPTGAPFEGDANRRPNLRVIETPQLFPGCVVQCRSHRHLVEEVEPADEPGGDTIVRMACLDDDANGQKLEVFWEREVDARVLGKSTWETVGQRGFDDPQVFSSYLHTLQWNCVTSTDPQLFQAPLRAGIDVKPYQLEPLRKALLMPRVSLFIADDVGLGKTIEAGLIMRELLLRQKVHRVVVIAPPSVVLQWQGEMQSRFGLHFAVMDRKYMAQMRQQRGWGINPWATHTRFILSQSLVRDEGYAGPLRDWLGDEGKQTLLILDEAHNAAPASGSKFAVDSKLTKSIRDLAGRFEHKLFLSATPHNGHSNSFSALLEILDPTRFCRGVAVRKKDLEPVLVRRLKEDLRGLPGVELPKRNVNPVVLDNLPGDTPELVLADLLRQYRDLRNARLAEAGARERAAELLVVTNLQKRLLSSIYGFDRTLNVHIDTLKKREAAGSHGSSKAGNTKLERLDLLQDGIDGDDDRAEISDDELEAEAAQQHATALSSALQVQPEEWQLLEQMQRISANAKFRADARIGWLEDWIRQHLCPNLGQPGAPWADERLLIFTEYADTKAWLETRLRELVAGSDQADQRIATFHGGIDSKRREALKRSFNSPPGDDPLRILVATDAAREGVNLQNHCRHLVHFDVPWNPGRMEQRNGRIDRTLQRAPEVFCHYFVLPQRPEDTVLDTLVQKTEQIKQELGCLPPVVISKLSALLKKGINPTALQQTMAEIDGVDRDEAYKRTQSLLNEELEESRQRQGELAEEVAKLERFLKKSEDWLNFSSDLFRDALNTSLKLTGSELALKPRNPAKAAEDPDHAIWDFPSAKELPGGDARWGDVLDALRPARQPGQKLWQWRRETELQPVVFKDPQEVNADRVHLHLEHPLVQRLLNRFLMRGFQTDEISRAAVVGTHDDTAKLILLGRLSLYGHSAARLHDEVLAVVAEWYPDDPSRQLHVLGKERQERALADLEQSLKQRLEAPVIRQHHLREQIDGDVQQLISHLEGLVDERREKAQQKLIKRAETESERFIKVLSDQRQRIESTKTKTDHGFDQLVLGFAADERRQMLDNRAYWERRLHNIERDLALQPDLIKRTFDVQTHRIEPAGAIYLWPISQGGDN